MKVVFVSSRLTQHQIPFCDAMQRLCTEFTFVQCSSGADAFEGKGGKIDRGAYPYLAVYSETPELCEERIQGADALVVSAPYLKLVKAQMRAGKTVFVYLERFYKIQPTLLQDLKIRIGAIIHHGIYQKYKPMLLCASAYCAQDAARLGLYKNRCYQWGYFPPFYDYDVQTLLQKKNSAKKAQLLWVGRMLDWKHPDDAVAAAKRLKEQGFSFQMNLIGCGEMEKPVSRMIDEEHLQDCVTLLGAKPPETVREYMEQADVYLFTSDFYEGWGAVLNEAMNSGCAVAASHAIGAAPVLLQNGKNGLLYESGNVGELAEKLGLLLQDAALRESLGRAAYETIKTEWNADCAAERLLLLIEAVQRGEDGTRLYKSGPCSKAEYRKNAWYPA